MKEALKNTGEVTEATDTLDVALELNAKDVEDCVVASEQLWSARLFFHLILKEATDGESDARVPNKNWNKWSSPSTQLRVVGALETTIEHATVITMLTDCVCVGFPTLSRRILFI